jgi:hypothetical protein
MLSDTLLFILAEHRLHNRTLHESRPPEPSLGLLPSPGV